MTKSEKLAHQYYDADGAAAVLEDQLDSALVSAMGSDPSEPDSWPFGNLVYDAYDSSFELHGTRDDWTPTPEQLAAAWALGFARGWVCYVGGMERYYAPAYPDGHLKPSHRAGTSEGTRRERQLLRALQEVEQHCPCGARPESLKTHPHVGPCPVGRALGR